MRNGILLLFVMLSFSFIALSQERPIKVKDDPVNRVIYEYNRLINPATGKIPDNIREKELEFIKNQNLTDRLKGTKATAWVHRGPFNLGGRTRALAIDVNNENIILAGGVSGGMWRSVDGGISWTKATGSSDLHSVTAIAQDVRAGQTNTWYYTTGELKGNSASGGDPSSLYRGNGLFKSVDNGVSWTEIVSTTSNTPESFTSNFQYCWNVKVNPQNGDVLVATYGMVYRSVDGGSTWTTSINGGTAKYTDIAISSTGIIYATLSNNAVNEGIYRSTDGVSWTDITPTGFPASFDRIVLDIASSDEDTVYFLANTLGSGVNNHNLWKYQYISGDGTGAGGNWTNLSGQIPDLNEFTGDFDSQDSYDLLIKVKPDDVNFVLIGGTNLFRSTDGFSTTGNTTWIGGYTPNNNSYDSYSNHHADQHALVFYPLNPNKVISGHDGGLSRTTDITKTTVVNGETVVWASLNTGYLTTQAYAVAIDQEHFHDDKILAGFQDNGSWSTKSSNGATDWEYVLGGDGAFCAFGNNGLSWFTSSQLGVVYIDVYNSDETYNYWTRVDPNGAVNQLFITPFVIDPNNTNRMYYQGGDVIWRNSNLLEIPKYSNAEATINWLSLSNSKITGSTITAIDISKIPANILFYGGANGKLFKTVNAHLGDPNPVDITGGSFPTGNIGCVKVNPLNVLEIFVSFTNYSVLSIWHSTDGITWESISGNLEENIDGSGSGPSVRWVSMLEIDALNHIYFAATSIGLFSTTFLDGINTVWVQEGVNTIGNVVVDMVKTRADGTVVVATHANGVYSAKYSTEVSVPINESVNLIEAKVYPNPSDGIFNIEIKGETLANYLITIYDMQGKSVYFSEQKNILSITQQVDLYGFTKGVYSVEIVKGGKANNLKLILK